MGPRKREEAFQLVGSQSQCFEQTLYTVHGQHIDLLTRFFFFLKALLLRDHAKGGAKMLLVDLQTLLLPIPEKHLGTNLFL